MKNITVAVVVAGVVGIIIGEEVVSVDETTNPIADQQIKKTGKMKMVK